jgi:hypothetical protein
VGPVVGPVDGDERLADIAQGGFAVESQLRFGHEDPHRPPSHAADHAFYQAANGVWLTNHVPPGYLSDWPH